MLDGLPVIREAFARIVRLVSTARLRESVLSCLVDNELELDELAEIEGATSTRLAAQDRGLESVAANEFVYGIPHAKFINAAFAYSKPRELNRFNGPGRGAWYAALDTETCLQEVVYHMNEFLDRAGDYHAVVEYAEMFASLAGEYVDLRQVEADHPCLSKDPAIAYPAGNAVADAARAKGLNGIIYPSVRRPGGTCFVALWPHAVQSVAPGDVIRIAWSGTPVPSIERAVGGAIAVPE
jgi:RES domain-containing protein